MKILLTILGYLLIAAIVAGLIVGLVSLLIWDSNNDNRAFNERCEKVAKLAGIKEYNANGSYCYVLKDGKITEVEI